jgi:hypothetical protein
MNLWPSLPQWSRSFANEETFKKSWNYFNISAFELFVSETLSILPFSFLGGDRPAHWRRRLVIPADERWHGLPMLVVLATAAAWYVGDAFYNDYANNHAKLFDADTLSGAWWQVAWFLAVFLVMTPPIHQWLNRRYLQRRSGVMQLFKQGVDQPEIQKSLNALFMGLRLGLAHLVSDCRRHPQDGNHLLPLPVFGTQCQSMGTWADRGRL